MRKWYLGALIVWVALFLVTLSLAGASEKSGPAGFFKDKAISVLVPTPPGGGHDTVARLIAPYLRENTGANVVVKNMPGGNMLLAPNFLWMKAKKDGLTIANISGGTTIMAQLMGAPEARFDLTKGNTLGGFTALEVVYVVRADSNYRSFADLVSAKETIQHPTTGPTSSYALPVWFMLRPMGVKVSMVHGYSSSPEIALAIVRGEFVAGACPVYTVTDYIKQGKLRPLFITGDKRSELLPDVPTIYEVSKPNEHQKFWLNFVSDIFKTYRIAVTNPGVPKERVAFLREAFDKTFKNKKLIESLVKAGHTGRYIPGKDVQKTIDSMIHMDESKLKEIKELAAGN